ncbi:glycosyltransferase, partial [Morganella morganii]
LIFPSLLESFSATPVEAMKMKVPVIASDLPFVRSICKDSAFYFNPLDPYSIAESIFYAYSNKELCQQKISAADKIVSQLPTAKDRANDYIKIINATLNKYQEK